MGILALALVGLRVRTLDRRLRVGLAAGVVVFVVLSLGFQLGSGEWLYPYRWLYAALARRTRTLQRALTRALSLPVRDRVLDALTELAALRGCSLSSGLWVLVPLSQEDLGAMVGATRESVNRAIRQLVRDGAVRRWNDAYVVRPQLAHAQGQDEEPGVS